jgi:hypothetical protein
MRNLRNAMLVAVVAATALAAIAGFFLGGPPTRILVDAGLAVALAVIVGLMLSPTVARTEALVEALRALARGDKHQRVSPDDYAGLAEVARAMNEVAASLTEGEDPNLGPVKSTPRPRRRSTDRERERPALVDDGRAVVEPSDDPAIGPVRVMKKQEPIPLASGKNGEITKSAAAASISGSSPASPRPSAATASSPSSSPSSPSSPSSSSPATSSAGSTPPSSSGVFASGSDAAVTSAERPEIAAPTNDTNIDMRPRSDVDSSVPSSSGSSSSSSGSSGSGLPASSQPSDLSGPIEPPQLPSRGDLEALFQEFVAAKKSHDEAVADLDFEAFAQTIHGECERLVAAHRCRGVRFEVTMQDGEVSLRPRLLR